MTTGERVRAVLALALLHSTSLAAQAPARAERQERLRAGITAERELEVLKLWHERHG